MTGSWGTRSAPALVRTHAASPCPAVAALCSGVSPYASARNSSAAPNIGHAITAEGDGPGKFPAVPGGEIPPCYDCFSFDYFLETKPMVFRIANLSAGEYVVTLVTGSYDNCERSS